MSYQVVHTTEQVTQSGYVESNCLSIAFKIKDLSGGVVEIDGFELKDGDGMYSLSNEYPGFDITRYYVKFTTPGILYVIRKRVVGENKPSSSNNNSNYSNCG